MRLPALSVIVASQAIIWCFAGTWIHGWKILLYPLSWCLVGAAFYFHNKKYPIAGLATHHTSKGPWANSKKPTDVEASESTEDSADKQKLATAD